jgi:NAD(P)-dependent dehydrogenase (short-subunit alcohol dehydrogenase family)
MSTPEAPAAAAPVALVTGGSRGIGAAVARRLAADGHDVAVTYVTRPDLAEQVVADVEELGHRAVALESDAADAGAAAAAVDEVVARLGRLDVLVNNAGIAPFGELAGHGLAEVDRTIAIHVRGPFLYSQAAARHLPPGGRIVTIGTSLVERVPAPGATLYTMSKAAVVGLTKGLARDLGPRGITANVVHPGPTDTDMNPADGPGAAEQVEVTALGRFARAEDVAAAVAYLVSDAGRNVTGAALAVDAGFAA